MIARHASNCCERWARAGLERGPAGSLVVGGRVHEAARDRRLRVVNLVLATRRLLQRQRLEFNGTRRVVNRDRWPAAGPWTPESICPLEAGPRSRSRGGNPKCGSLSNLTVLIFFKSVKRFIRISWIELKLKFNTFKLNVMRRLHRLAINKRYNFARLVI